MKKNKSQYMSDFSTSAQFIMKKWRPIQLLIEKYMGVTASEAEASHRLVPNNEIEDLMNGVFSFCLRGVIDALVKMEQLLVLLKTSQDDNLQIKADLYEKLDCVGVDASRISLPKVEKTQKKMMEAVSGLYERLAEFHQEAGNILSEKLAQQDVRLNANEQDEMGMIETREKLIRRLDDLRLNSLADKEVLSFESYFNYKARIMISNALSRTHLPHAHEDIERVMKKLKSTFTELRKLSQQFAVAEIDPLKEHVSASFQSEEG